MIDFIKILPEINHDIIESNPILKFQGNYIKSNGEVKEYPIKAEFQNLLFEIKDNSSYIKMNEHDYAIHVILSGSLHKYFNLQINEHKQNYDDFTFRKFLFVVKELYDKFGINPFLTKIVLLEFGINFLLPYNAKKFIRDSIITHKWKEPTIQTRFKNKNGKYSKGYLKQFEHQHYLIKCYAKGLQYNKDLNLMRFEIKVLKHKYFEDRKITINTLADLLNPDILKSLTNELHQTFNELVIYDSQLKFNSLKPKEIDFYKHFNNYQNWILLKEQLTKSNFDKKVKKYNDILLQNSSLKNDIRLLIEQKAKYLISHNLKTGYELTNFLEQMEQLKWVLFNTSNIEIESTHFKQIDYSNVLTKDELILTYN